MNLKNSVPVEELTDVLKCKYYDDNEFNAATKSTRPAISLLHVNLQSSSKILGYSKHILIY
jgi:hypothetical protein